MIEFTTKLKRWGRSFGIVVPMSEINKSRFTEKDRIEVIITKEKTPLKKHFGSFKFKRSTEEILNEGDKESWDE